MKVDKILNTNYIQTEIKYLIASGNRLTRKQNLDRIVTMQNSGIKEQFLTKDQKYHIIPTNKKDDFIN